VPGETGGRIRVGSWDWHVPTNTAIWSDGMCAIDGPTPGSAMSRWVAGRSVVSAATMIQSRLGRSSGPRRGRAVAAGHRRCLRFH
jgi:hypothetical protein